MPVLMIPPEGAINVKYNGIKLKANQEVEILDGDVEALSAEGWTVGVDSTPSPDVLDAAEDEEF